MKTTKITMALIAMLITSVVTAQTYRVNVNESNIKWTGKKVGGEHFGNISLKSGNLSIKSNKIVGGEFVIDMNSITNADLDNKEYNAKLVGHLKSDDFFGVDTYPMASLKINEATKFMSGKAIVKAALTIKGTTQPIDFEVYRDGETFSSTLVVDRSKYDIKYGSSSFFKGLGDKVIYDEFTLEIKLLMQVK